MSKETDAIKEYYELEGDIGEVPPAVASMMKSKSRYKVMAVNNDPIDVVEGQTPQENADNSDEVPMDTSVDTQDPDRDSLETSNEQQNPEEEEDSQQEQHQGHDYEKRWKDLKKAYDTNIRKERDEKEALLKRIEALEAGNVENSLPESDEELEAFKNKYPEVYNTFVKLTENKIKASREDLEKDLADLKKEKERTQRSIVIDQVRKTHNDIDDFREGGKHYDEFVEWFQIQRPTIQSLVSSKVEEDIILGINQFKRDTGRSLTSRPSKQSQVKKNLASSVDVKGSQPNPTAGKRPKVWTASEIRKMSLAEYEKNEDAILQARMEGNFRDDL